MLEIKEFVDYRIYVFNAEVERGLIVLQVEDLQSEYHRLETFKI